MKKISHHSQLSQPPAPERRPSFGFMPHRAAANVGDASAHNNVGQLCTAERLPHFNEATEPNVRTTVHGAPQNPYESTQNASQYRSRLNQDAWLNQGKKGYAVEAYFRDRKFTGAPDQSIENTIPDFEICEV